MRDRFRSTLVLHWSTAQQLISSVLDEFRLMRDTRLTEEELRRVKDHLKGATLLALEGSGNACPASRAITSHFNRHFTTQELISMLESVTIEEIQTIAREFFQPERLAASVVGNLNGFTLTRDQLEI